MPFTHLIYFRPQTETEVKETGDRVNLIIDLAHFGIVSLFLFSPSHSCLAPASRGRLIFFVRISLLLTTNNTSFPLSVTISLSFKYVMMKDI